VDVACSDVVRDGGRIVCFPGATRNSLNTSILIIFRVGIFTTLKMIKALIASGIRVARPVGKLKKDGVEVVSDTNQLKMRAPDGKMRLTDVLDASGVVELTKCTSV